MANQIKNEIKIAEHPKENKPQKPSELRQDIITGDWVVIATGRAKRPEELASQKREPIEENPGKLCFFCEPEKMGQEKDVLLYQTSDGDWSLRVFPNKYPAFTRSRALKYFEEGPYFGMDGAGYHEIIVTRDHTRQLALLDGMQAAEVIDAYQNRYLDLMNKKSVNYIEIFHNHGKEAGASIAHPHSQLMAIPVVSPYVQSELDGARVYHQANKQCAYCTIVEWERERKKRIILENDRFIAFCPFSSRVSFEVWILPKMHVPYFERISNEDKISLGKILQESLNKIYSALKDPAYNFYLHTSPCDGKDYPHFHYHIEILPRTSVWAGFELSTGIEISTIQPEKAAEYLREQS